MNKLNDHQSFKELTTTPEEGSHIAAAAAALDELTSEDSCESLTFGSTTKDEEYYQQSSYQSDDEIGPIKVEGHEHYDDEESMTVALQKAQIFVESSAALGVGGGDGVDGSGNRIKVFETKANSSAIKTGKQILVDFSGSCIDKKWTKNQTSDLAEKQSILYQKYYLGPLTSEKAINKCQIRSEWFIFHFADHSISDAAASISETFQLPPSLHLYIVYRRNDNGDHELYPIRCSKTMFYVDYGDTQAPKFYSIYGLLKFYNNFGYVNLDSSSLFSSPLLSNHHHHRQYHSEVFPVWKRATRVPTISEYSSLSSSECSWIPGDSIFDSSDSATTVSSGEFCSSSASEGETNCDL